jgi:molybdopterin converting factor subunit 1
MQAPAFIQVRLFAALRDAANADTLEVSLPHGGMVRDLRQRLGEQHPRLAALLSRSAVALNQEFVGDDMQVPQSAEIALLPPVSGG